jgi:hypothetical protein
MLTLLQPSLSKAMQELLGRFLKKPLKDISANDMKQKALIMKYFPWSAIS